MTMITPSYLGETIEYSSLHACRSTLEDPTLRDKVHLLHVGSLPCLICGRQPCHAHHVRYAQHHGLSQKVSDEFVVPLCFLHHRALHDCGSERSWWQGLGTDPLPIAAQLWEMRTNRTQVTELAKTPEGSAAALP